MVVDGWLLAQQGHGLASFSRTLIDDLASTPGAPQIAVAVPRGSVPAVREPLRALALRSPFRGIDVLGEAAWQNRLGRFVRDRHAGEAFLAPSLFFSTARPHRSVVVCHDLIPLRYPRYLGRFFYRRWLFHARLRWLRQAAAIIVDSAFTRTELQAHLGGQAPAITVAPLWTALADSPAPSDARRAAVRQRYGLPERYWLYLGGYDYRKNVEFLIEAYGRVAATPGCPPLVLGGRIPTDLARPVCDVTGALRRHGLSADRVRLPGFIADDDLAAVYAGAELFVYPSQAEGFGLPPVEAMCCGCPAFVADATSLPEVVSDAGYRFPLAESSTLAAMLAAAASAPRPLNPGFDRAFFGRTRGLRDYLAVIASVE